MKKLKAKSRFTDHKIPAMNLINNKWRYLNLSEFVPCVPMNRPVNDEVNTIIFLNGDFYGVASIDLEFNNVERTENNEI